LLLSDYYFQNDKVLKQGDPSTNSHPHTTALAPVNHPLCQVGLDVWLHHITAVYAGKERFSRFWLVCTALCFATGFLGVRLEDSLNTSTAVPSSRPHHCYLSPVLRTTSQQVKVSVYAGQVGFYVFGTFFALIGHFSRKQCICVGVVDYDTNVHGEQAFQVPLDLDMEWRVNDCVDTIRLLQLDFVMRQQRGSEEPLFLADPDGVPDESYYESNEAMTEEETMHDDAYDSADEGDFFSDIEDAFTDTTFIES